MNNRLTLILMAAVLACFAAKLIHGQPASRSSGAVLTLGDEDLPVADEPSEGAYQAIQAFHAAVRDGNTTKVLSMLSDVPQDPAQRKALLDRLSALGKDLAQGKRDFFVMEVRTNGPYAVAFINEVKTPFVPAGLDTKSWFLRKKADQWNLFAELTAYPKPGAKDAPDAQATARLEALKRQFEEEKGLVAKDPFTGLTSEEEGAERIAEMRRKMWAVGKKPGPPPKPHGQ